MVAATHMPINSDVHKCEGSAMADPLSLAFRPAYGSKVQVNWDLSTMLKTIIVTGVRIVAICSHGRSSSVYRVTACDGEYIYCPHVLSVLCCSS
jgi:hypothetical protein